MMQCDVGVAPEHACQQRDAKSQGCLQRLVTKSGEQQVEPDHVRLALANGLEQLYWISEAVEVPYPDNVKLRQLRLIFFQLVAEHGHAEQRIVLQLSRYVIPVFIQPPLARRERSH